MQVTYDKENLNDTDVRKTLVSVIGDAKHGGFMRVHGFQSKSGHGEIQDTTYCKGITYPNAIKKSLEMLDEIEANKDFSITVTRGVWENNKGEVSPTGRKNKNYPNAKTRTEVYGYGNGNEPILVEAITKLRKSLTAPERPTKEYDKLGNGVYQDEETGVLYIRDLRLVQKTIIEEGDYPHKAGAEVNAVRDAIKRDMPIGNYRMFRLDADFDSITLGGIEIVTDELSVEAKKVRVSFENELEDVENAQEELELLE